MCESNPRPHSDLGHHLDLADILLQAFQRGFFKDKKAKTSFQFLKHLKFFSWTQEPISCHRLLTDILVAIYFFHPMWNLAVYQLYFICLSHSFSLSHTNGTPTYTRTHAHTRRHTYSVSLSLVLSHSPLSKSFSDISHPSLGKGSSSVFSDATVQLLNHRLHWCLAIYFYAITGLFVPLWSVWFSYHLIYI